MNTKISNVFKMSKKYLVKRSPEILTGIGIAGMITGMVLAVKETPKAMKLIDEAEKMKGEKLNTYETIKVAYAPYIPATVTVVLSISCIIGASTIKGRRNAALAAAYTLSESTLLRYKDKVVQTLGEKKEKEIRDEIAQDMVSEKPFNNNQVIISSNGDTLFFDSISGRYFKSDVMTIKSIINELNAKINCQDYISLSEFYYEIGLEPTSISNAIGWNSVYGMIDVDFSTCMTEDYRSCIVLNYAVQPRYDYDKLM